MISCTYKLFDYTFNSELELDGFLLGRKDFLKQFGDEVFAKGQKADKHILNVNTLKSEIGPEAIAKDLRRKFQEAKRNYIDGEEIVELEKPYTGVTSYLTKIKIDGVRLIPEFTPDYTEEGLKGYWPRRIDHWTGKANSEETGQPKWTEEEINLFFNGDEELANNTTLSPADKDTIQLYRELMTKRWKTQADFGTEIHNVLSYLFSPSKSKNSNGRPRIFEYSNLGSEKIITYIQRAIDNGYIKAESIADNSRILRQIVTYSKTLLEQIKGDEDIENLEFYSELPVAAPLTGPVDSKDKYILGVIDLLVVDKAGNIHIYDFKTSPKTYEQYGDVKKNTFTYQLNTYRHILNTAGLNTFGSTINILPIQLDDFKLTNPEEAFNINKEGDTYLGVKNAKFAYKGIKYDADDLVKNLDQILVNKQYIEDNVSSFLPQFKMKPIMLTDMFNNVAKDQSTWFSGNEAGAWEDESIIDFIKEKGMDEPESDGKYHFRSNALFMKDIVADSEPELITKVKKEIESYRSKKEYVITTTLKALDESLEKNELANLFITPKRTSDEQVSLDWSRNIFEKYVDGNWTRMKGGAYDALVEQYGLIVLRNTITSQFNFIKLSTNNLGNTKIFGNNMQRQYITGAFQTDAQVESDPNNRAFLAEQGFVEIMEIMNIINNLGEQFKENEGFIGEMSVINPFMGTARQATNEQTLWNYKTFVQKYGLAENEADYITTQDAPIKFLTGYELAYQMLKDAVNGTRAKGKFLGQNFHTMVSSLDQYIYGGNKEMMLTKMQEIARFLEKEYKWLKVVPSNPEAENNKIRAIYDQVMIGIANLQGINFDVQTKDHSKWLEAKGISVLTKGWGGLYIDNPGNLKSKTLNLTTKLITEAYQQVRQDMVDPKTKTRELLTKLKQEKGYSKIKQAFGDWRQLYGNMFREDKEEFLFKNPYIHDMSNAEREFLTYIIPQMLLSKPGNTYTLEEIIDQMKNDNLEFFKVPLAIAGTDKETMEYGIIGGLKEKLKAWDPRHWRNIKEIGMEAYEKMMARATGDFGTEENFKSPDSKLFEMSNIFDSGYNPATRRAALQKHGQYYFEHDLETLFLKHQYAASIQKRIDNVFPLIKSAMIYLSRSGWEQGTSFKNDRDYMEKYIRASIKNENIWADTKELQQIAGLTSKMTRIASFMSLAFSPVQFTYQSFQGLLQTISFVLRKPTGAKFTMSEFMKAFRAVYSDLIDMSGEPTKCSLLNELYAFNDMDMNVYAERLKQDQTGLTNFAFKFASRPDYYNRLWIIVMEMMNDGSWDALEVKDGKLVYDWTKDKRFSKFANDDMSDPEEYNKQKALYISIYQQAYKEGTVKEPLDVTKKHPLPLPYTNLEIESKKSICDLIYGYYAHEKKSLVHNFWIGALAMQMRTYWSGKKNQYLAPGGVKLLGNWEQLKDSQGNLLYYQVIDGVVREDLPPTTTVTDVPFVQWRGKFQEGIIMTIMHELLEAKDNITEEGLIKGINTTYKELQNTDDWESYYRRNNLKQFVYDVLAYLIFGAVIASILKANANNLKIEAKKNQDLGLAVGASMAYIAYRTCSNAASDFNFFDGILSPLTVSVSPFSFNWWTNTSKNALNTLFGDKTFIQGLSNSMAVTKQFKPILDVIDARLHA